MVYEILKRDKTEAQAIIQCLQNKDITPEDTLALNCYRTLIIHKIQPRLTFVCPPKVKSHLHSLQFGKKICVAEECLGAMAQPSSLRGIAMHEHRLTKGIDVNGDYTKSKC